MFGPGAFERRHVGDEARAVAGAGDRGARAHGKLLDGEGSGDFEEARIGHYFDDALDLGVAGAAASPEGGRLTAMAGTFSSRRLVTSAVTSSPSSM